MATSKEVSGSKKCRCPAESASLKPIPDLTSNAIDPNDLSQLATQNALRDAWLHLNPSFPADRVHALPSIEHAVNIVRGLGKKQVLVAGSLHLVGGVMEVAGLQGALGMD
jgi:folylpolyglutamate synthase